MRICIDVQPAVAQRAGVGRYVLSLANSLAHCIPASDSMDLVYFDFMGRADPSGLPSRFVRPVRLVPGRLIQYSWKTLRWPPYTAFAPGADVYHFPNFILPPVRKGARCAVTIHDLSFIRHPEFAEERNLAYLRAGIQRTARSADAVLTVSSFSAREIEELLGVPRSRIHTTLLGVAPFFKPLPAAAAAAEVAALGIDRPFILTVGTIEPRKNLPFLVEVFSRLRAFDGLLVIAGSTGWKYADSIRAIENSSAATRIRRVTHVGDRLLPALYSAASAFVTTSHYEGFGLPPLEAMACGTPVISSSGGSLPEIVGEAGLVLRGFDSEEWAAALDSALADTGLRSRMTADGLKRAAGFTWRKTAEQTLQAYRSIAC